MCMCSSSKEVRCYIEQLSHHTEIKIIGPDDRNHPEVLHLKDWLSLLGGPLDYQYTTTEQPRGNSHILHSQAKVLGVFSISPIMKDHIDGVYLVRKVAAPPTILVPPRVTTSL